MTAGAEPVGLMAVAPAHAAVLAEIHRHGFAEPWNEAAMASLLAMPGCFGILALSDRPLGFVLARVAADEAEILTLAVLPDSRRRGIGGRLMEAASECARRGGARTLFLEVAEDNQPARAFYDTAGFTLHSRRRNYYPGPKDALVLRTGL